MAVTLEEEELRFMGTTHPMGSDPTEEPEAAREQVRHTIERLEEIRVDLEATAAGLRLSEGEEELDEPLAGRVEIDAVLRCSLQDYLVPLISSLRSLLADDS